MGMYSSGFNYSDEVLARMAVGVDPSTGESIPLPSHEDGYIWGAPSGTMFSTCNDMAEFMIHALAYAIEEPGPSNTSGPVDPSTFAELQMSGTVAGLSNSFGGVGAGTYEWVHLRSSEQAEGHWAFTKAGCLEGYRSDTLLVPELGLGIFAVATSTCDILGDGSPITVPLANLLAPKVQMLLSTAEQREEDGGSWLPPLPERFEGVYNCSGAALEVTLEQVALVARNFDTYYPMKLRFVDVSTDPSSNVRNSTMFNFQAHIIGPYIADEECKVNISSSIRDEKNICPTSCMMRLFRGDRNYVQFEVVAGDSEEYVNGIVSQGLDFSCAYMQQLS